MVLEAGPARRRADATGHTWIFVPERWGGKGGEPAGAARAAPPEGPARPTLESERRGGSALRYPVSVESRLASPCRYLKGVGRHAPRRSNGSIRP
jgi:hypothetical protein